MTHLTQTNLPNFCMCPRKHEARYKTIIEAYRELFFQKVPLGEQYISLCGTHVDKEGNFHQGSELGQLIEEGLITENQFIGIDREEKVIIANRNAKPDVCWMHSDFLKALRHIEPLNPGIINADFISMKERAIATASQVMDYVHDIKKNILLVCNIMLTNPHAFGGKHLEDIKINSEDIIKEFEKNGSFQYAWSSEEWDFYPNFYVYNGTGRKSRTIMGTFILFKR